MAVNFPHIPHPSSLVTRHEEIRAGFIAQALERNRRATPIVCEARALRAAALRVKLPFQLLNLARLQPALLSAAGVSEKAAGHMEPPDKEKAIVQFIEKFLDPAGPAFVDELVYRFLLTKGDALGGSLRNVGGAMAQQKLTRAILSSLTLTATSYQWLGPKNEGWLPMSKQDAGIEHHARGLAWNTNGEPRCIVYNLTVPLVRKNVDMCLLRCSPSDCTKKTFADAAAYVAVGELKGGIDPAGADEHWKTARTALLRIREAFGKRAVSPKTFFVGAAIVENMASEIWEALRGGTLDNAANLTKPNQVDSLCQWLISL